MMSSGLLTRSHPWPVWSNGAEQLMPIFFITSLRQGEEEIFFKSFPQKNWWKNPRIHTVERAGDQVSRTQPNEVWLHDTNQHGVLGHRMPLQNKFKKTNFLVEFSLNV